MSKVWLVTGSSRGLGRAIAEAILAHGDRLVATARTPEQLEDLKERYGDQVQLVALDVKSVDQAQAAVQSAIETFGRLDVVVNNAGYGNIVSIEQSTEEEFRDQIETVLWGVINVTRAALPTMRQQRSGHFIQISSIGGRSSAPGLGAYQTAKWGVGGFSEVLSKEAAPFGVKVTIIEPGAMATDWAGTSMHITQPSDDYQPSIGAVLGMVAVLGTNTHYGSDITKVAQAILQIADQPEPPLHLIMGSAALQMVLAADEARLAEARKWQSLSEWTDVENHVELSL